MSTSRITFFQAVNNEEKISKTELPENKKEIKSIQSQLSAWIETHKYSYISHAIWQDNVDSVLTDGYLSPAEYQLRKKSYVSFEKGMSFGERGVTDVSLFIDELKMQNTRQVIFVTIENQIPINKALYLELISKNLYNDIISEGEEKYKINESFSVKLRDGRDYKITYNTNGKCQFGNNFFQISGVPYLKGHYSGVNGNEWEFIESLSKKYQCDESYLKVAFDTFSDSPIDEKLSIVWNTYKKLCLSDDHRWLARHLQDVRGKQIYRTKLNCNIRASYNSINWDYGDIVVLRGNPYSILSILSKADSDKDMDLPIEDVKIKKGEEVQLLNPFENGGEFFSLNLSDEDTIIIGPHKILSCYQEQTKTKRLRLYFIEDMNTEQLDFFGVPYKLRPLAQQENEIHNVINDPIKTFHDKLKQKHIARFFNKWKVYTQESIAKKINLPEQKELQVRNKHQLG